MRKDVYLHEEGGGGFTDNLMQIVKVVPLAGTNVALRGITKEGGDAEGGESVILTGLTWGFENVRLARFERGLVNPSLFIKSSPANSWAASPLTRNSSRLNKARTI